MRFSGPSFTRSLNLQVDRLVHRTQTYQTSKLRVRPPGASSIGSEFINDQIPVHQREANLFRAAMSSHRMAGLQVFLVNS